MNRFVSDVLSVVNEWKPHRYDGLLRRATVRR